MPGPATLRAHKGLLSRYTNQLSRLIDEIDAAPANLAPTDQTRAQQLRTTSVQLSATSKLVMDTLNNFTTTVDSLGDSLSEEHHKQVTQYIEDTQQVLDRAHTLAIEIDARLSGVREAGPVTPMVTTKLPPIPIPTFTGNIEEFANFWTLFEANVHLQPLSDLQKFNYLVSALKGEARELVRRYPVTESNYHHAVTHLRQKYGNESSIIGHLYSCLEKAKAESNAIYAQRRLLEKIFPIVTQLEEHGVNLDGSYLSQKLLAKFAVALQRKTLEVCLTQNLHESDWKMISTLQVLDNFISTEEKINDMIGRDGANSNAPAYQSERSRRHPSQNIQPSSSRLRCMFCDSNAHKSADCITVSSLSDRRTFLLNHNKCLNCGRDGHFATRCDSRGCRNCNGQKHHHTICPRLHRAQSTRQAIRTTEGSQPSRGTDTTPPPTRHQKSKSSTTRTNGQRRTVSNPVQTQAEDTQEATHAVETTVQDETNAAVLHHAERDKGSDHVLLLTGVAKVRDEPNGQWKEVEILFDTGADQSFISKKLADDLGLECSEQQEFQMYTFGSQTPKQARCGVTHLNLWDNNGATHAVRLYTTQVLTAKGRPVHLSNEDREFVEKHNIQLSKSMDTRGSTPQILLGCDQLWELLDTPLPRYTLPSGLQLIPSRLGYLLSGKQQIPVTQNMQRAVRNMNTLTMGDVASDFEEELRRWDKYWTLDSAGICEFTGTKDAEKEAINQQVAKYFNETIERREDGYYVRFPYKQDHPPLPNNRNIAVKRLHSVLNMLRNDPKLLKDYDNTFKEQERMGIIEEVMDDPSETTGILHYIPHQPVITPHKETTKLRIVFDASSHYKDCPSLNDVLHQGPLILPDLYGLLIRFRIPPYVAISDVEKAFLQVRLHEQDRDATRFLWLKDLSEPVTESNILTLRFTRVTFGLNVSPYLLAATILHHLDHAVQDTELAKEISDNLYVDNLILGAKDSNELGRKAAAARQIFTDMRMNLREFLSNTDAVTRFIPPEALSKATTQKVLGVAWDATQDCLRISCSFPATDIVTKRLIARQIASIYDPLGWLVPLLTRPKHFQQQLWKDKFDWDTQLPTSVCNDWRQMVDCTDRFERTFPRGLKIAGTRAKLAVFADASDTAMATCAYLFDGSSSSLVMARCKLPSIRASTTIPKLEMNAVTMATRLALSVHRALERSTLNPKDIIVFSDSQIALNWLAISTTTSEAGVLVRNRVKEIRNIVSTLNSKGVSVRFAYVNTQENPADAGTRGLSRDQLRDHSLWWTGPNFLLEPETAWTTTFYPHAEQKAQNVVNEEAFIHAALVSSHPTTPLVDLDRFSSLLKAKRVTARILVFLRKLMRPLAASSQRRILGNIPQLGNVANSSSLTAEDISAARLTLIRDHQRVYLSKDYKKSMENTLRLFVDREKVWRSQGRLERTTLHEDAKSPIFIAPNTRLAWLIIQDAHGTYHQGIEHTMATVRQTYWIPKIRQQTRKLVQQCVKCRRFNALPYLYPEATDLPERRVLRSRPFEHIGLDFFDLPKTSETPENKRYYGCIFTCTVTRLIHLEMVESMNAVDFINALRRFVARRGLPKSITCDNAPTFLMTSSLFANGTENAVDDKSLEVLANNEIRWKHITPYAPWQGGFYERLIKSIKHALYKALRGSAQRSGSHLQTTLTEIEACLNSRPLTYQSAHQESLSSVRPIDFLQRDINVLLPAARLTQPEEDDADYLPPDELRALQSRQQVITALASSCEATEKFWKIWQEQYLTSLRERQKTLLTSRRQGTTCPKVGDVVLVSDPVLPRNDWRMARIIATRTGTDGAIRELELKTSTQRKIRRPVNLVVPLEINSDSEEDTPNTRKEDTTTAEETKDASPAETTTRYHLRPRRPRNYVDQNVTAVSTRLRKPLSAKWFLFHLMVLALISPLSGLYTQQIQMTCTPKGVVIHTSTNQSFELCTDVSCETYHPRSNPLLVKLPPEVTLHDHAVTLKWHDDDKLAVMETTCPKLDFCEQVDCTICATILFNPECWPIGGILTLALLLYAVIAFVYVLLYVPMTIGKPIRLLSRGIVLLFFVFARAVRQCCSIVLWRIRRQTRTTSAKLAAALAILTILFTLSTTEACEHVDVFQNPSTTCIQSNGQESCSTKLAVLLKLNSFQREACLRLTNNGTLLSHVKLTWKGLYLRCERETYLFTRAVELRTVDSKRCPTMGSCVDEKCAGINSSSLIPELEEGNHFPGRTGCLESCGGWGCDCFYTSSGCLFYRVYAVPKNDKVYELSRCIRWAEEVKLDLKVNGLDRGPKERRYVVRVIPTVPTSLPSLRLTMTSLTLPPTPSLYTRFISDGNDIAVYEAPQEPSLQCTSKEAAESMNCSLIDICRCTGAEFKVTCECMHNNIVEEFNKLDRKLPLTTSAWEMKKRDEAIVAKIPHLVSADFIMEFNASFTTVTNLQTDDTCSIPNTQLRGCYRCARGAEAHAECKSTSDTTGEILCGQHAFVVPCSPQGAQSTLRFHFGTARQSLNCSIRCGREEHYFAVTGVLKYVGHVHTQIGSISGTSSVHNEFAWPDFTHVFGVLLSWYKTLLLALVGVMVALLVSYIYLQWLSLTCFRFLLRLTKTIMCLPVRMFLVLISHMRKKSDTAQHQKLI